MQVARWTVKWIVGVAPALAALVLGVSPSPSYARSSHVVGSVCANVAGPKPVKGPEPDISWRIGLTGRTAVFDSLPGRRLRQSEWVGPREAPSLLVIAPPRSDQGRCWVRVRLPWRPNNASGWINADNVSLTQTGWRIEVSTARRTLTLFQGGKPVRTISVVVGAPGTPTPNGLFAIAWAVPWNPNAFLGSWVLELTAHSNVLQQFDGGDGLVGIHGRGGASLLNPLGTAASHGCIRLANADIDWLVHRIRAADLPGIPVEIS